MTYALPSLLDETDNWGAFIFFAAWCGIAILYVFLLVPEMAGYTVEEIDRMFTGPWRVAGFRGLKGGGKNRNGDGDGDDAEGEGVVIEGRDLGRVK